MIASLTQNNLWMPFKTLNGSLEGAAFVDKFDTFLFDCDGVIWQGNNLIPGVHSVLETLKRLGKRILFVTNNSSKSRASYLEKFASLGIETGIDNIFGSSYCAGMRVNASECTDCHLILVSFKPTIWKITSNFLKIKKYTYLGWEG